MHKIDLHYFSRTNPSPRYLELIEQNTQMHVQGDRRRGTPSEETFNGHSILPHLDEIEILIKKYNCKTLLDYGSGKAVKYGSRNLEQKWGIRATFYDPAWHPFSSVPQDKFDAVVCTDVLEHCPEEDISWILEEIFSYATLFVYLTIGCFPSGKFLPNGENTHTTVRPPEWWTEKIELLRKKYPALDVQVVYDLRKKKKKKIKKKVGVLYKTLAFFKKKVR